MNTIDRILEFINKNDETITEPQTDTVSDEHIQNTTQQQEPTHEEIQQDVIQTPQATNEELPRDGNVTDYKQTLRQLNKLMKRNDYPCIAKIDGKNRIFNSDVELSDTLNQMKASHRLQLKEMKRQHIDNYKHFSEEYQRNDEDIEDDGLIYKRGDIVAVKKADKVYKAPRTNKKDRQRIYNSIKDNKKLLTDLTLSKDEEHFKTISSDNLRNEELNIYHKHRDNRINKDTTWTRSSFLAMMSKFINNDVRNYRTNTPPPQYVAQQAPQHATQSLRHQAQQHIAQQSPQTKGVSYGLNPLLFGKM